MQIAVNEIFGPTFQGEGPSLGRLAIFLRLAMCNLKCTWCDTKYTWDWQNYSRDDEIHLWDVRLLIKTLLQKQAESNAALLVITGGEPMLQREALGPIIQAWPGDVEIETNGTVKIPDWWRDVTFNVSLKTSNSGNPLERRLNAEAVHSYIEHDYYRFKFVVESPACLDEVEALVNTFEIDPERVWIMPQARSKEELDSGLRNISEEVLARGWNLTTRLHIQLWANSRAR